MNLWILTEERPKKKVLKEIINKICKDNKYKCEISDIKINPIINNKKFTFTFEIKGVTIEKIDRILMKIVSGGSSFVDFLIYIQENEPEEDSTPLYAIEETKTSDYESRNTGVYQRCSKFVYVELYYPNTKKIMLYNIQIEQEREPTDTNIFGTRMLLTLGVEILGKTLDETVFKKFESIDEFIELKEKMRGAPTGNVPILIKKYNDKITVSGRLYKSGGLSHDPNIGALSIISKTLRKLGWDKDIIIIQHGLSQNNIGRTNKFIKIANEIDIKLDGLQIPHTTLPEQYWHYENKSEKLATIFLHLVLEEQKNTFAIYENHAGCERGYFIDNDGSLITVHKYIENDKDKGIINLPDLIICDKERKQILNIEGKTFENRASGISELKSFEPIEKEYISNYYPDYEIIRLVALFGGNSTSIDDENIGFLLNEDGDIVVSENTPEIVVISTKDYHILFKQKGLSDFI